MTISLIAPLDGTSFGLHARQLIKRLPQYGIRPVVRPLRPVGDIEPDVAKRVRHGSNECPIEIILGHPTTAPTQGKRTIYFAAWESTRLPKQHVNLLNQCAAVVVPSNYCATVFSASGVEVPIHVIPLGVSEAFTYQPWLSCTGKNFTFACAGNLRNGAERKGVQKVIDCFVKAFTGSDPNEVNVSLLVKVAPGDKVNTHGDDRITVQDAWMPEAALVQWLARCHCFVHFGTGAFELQVLEAMAIGRCVMAMNFGGHADYFEGITIPHRLVPADSMWKGHGCFAAPSEEIAVRHMRSLAGNWDYARRIGLQATVETANLTWDVHAAHVAHLLKTISAQWSRGGGDMVRVTRDYVPKDKKVKAREHRARKTWKLFEARELLYQNNGRSSADLGDKRALPYVKDMIDVALMSGKENIVVIHNNDIAFDDRLQLVVGEWCKHHGCYWAYRVPKRHDVHTDGGCDFFAFTREWWALNKHMMPDLFLGQRWWDNILRRLMKWSGCPEGPRLYYHEPHPGVETRNDSPAEKHNVELARVWLKEHDEPEADKI